MQGTAARIAELSEKIFSSEGLTFSKISGILLVEADSSRREMLEPWLPLVFELFLFWYLFSYSIRYFCSLPPIMFLNCNARRLFDTVSINNILPLDTFLLKQILYSGSDILPLDRCRISSASVEEIFLLFPLTLSVGCDTIFLEADSCLAIG